MRRLLSLTVMAGLAASPAALADSASSSATAPASTDRVAMTEAHQPALPSFLRDLLVKAGVLKKPEPPPMHPWVAWWMRTFDVQPPDKIATPTAPSTPATPAPSAANPTTTTASR